MRYHWRPWRQLNTNKFPSPQTNIMSAYDADIGEPESSQDTPLRNTTPMRPAADTTAQSKRTGKLNECQMAHCLAVDIRQLDTLNDEILPFIKDSKEKSRRSKESLHRLCAVANAAAGQDQDDEMPDSEDDPDDSLVDRCTKSHPERADALHEAIKNNEKIGKMVVGFEEDLRRAQINLEGTVERMRLEYKARLDEQREDMDYKYNQMNMYYNKKLQEKQTIIDQMTRNTAKDLHPAEGALSEGLAELAPAENSRLEDWGLRDVQEEQAEITFGQDRHVEASDKRKLRLQNEMNLARNALSEQHRREIQAQRLHTQHQLKDLEMKLNVRKEFELQAQRDSTHGQHLLDRSQLKRVWKADLKKRLAAEWSGKLAEADAARLEVSSRLTAAVTAKQSIVRKLKIKSDLLAWETSTLSNTELDLKNLRIQASTAAQEISVHRSVITRKDRHINGLEDTEKKLKASITRLRSNIDRNDTELKAQASTIASQKKNVQELETANQGLLKEKYESSVSMTRLVAEIFKLRSDIDIKKEELKSQANLVKQRDTALHDLETANTRLCQAETKATNDIVVLKTRLSTLDSDVKTRDEEMRAHLSAAILKHERIERLELANTGLLERQREAYNDKVSLQIAFESAYDRQKELETELDIRGRELSAGNRETEQVKKELSIEKTSNRTKSLEESLKVANEEIEILSSNLREETECLGNERSNNASLLSALQRGRIFPGVLASEAVLVYALKLVRERKALMIVERPSQARIVWHESLDRCEIQVKNWAWCLRLEKGSDGGPDESMEVRIEITDSPDLKNWLKGPDVVSANN